MKRFTFIVIAALLVMLNIGGNDLFTNTTTTDIHNTLPTDLPNQH